MKESESGSPSVGPSTRQLGVRPRIDIPALQPDDIVQPGEGGLSVSPYTPLNLPSFRRPKEWQGTGKDPVWQIDTDDLGPDLTYRPDPDNEKHGFIEPNRPMTEGEYADAIARTRDRWRKTQPKMGDES